MPYKNPDKQREFQARWCREKRKEGKLKTTTDDRKKAMVVAAKSVPCAICHETFPTCCIDMHHRNPEEKKYEIGDFKRWGIKYLEEELEKCVALCACCHRKLHEGLVELAV